MAKTPAWQRKEGKSKSGTVTAKALKRSYRKTAKKPKKKNGYDQGATPKTTTGNCKLSP